MQEHGYHTALIVSHNYHLMRAMEMANILAMDAHPVGTDSVNIFIPYYRVKEGFAYTKWTYHKLFVLPTQESEGNKQFPFFHFRSDFFSTTETEFP
ncbi:hypothetical protein ACLMAB_17170 [Brevibacillus laterosporus]